MAKKDDDTIVSEQSTDMMDWETALHAKMLEQERQKMLMASGPKFLAFKGGRLLVDEVPIPDNTLKVIVLAFAAENAYYPKKFDPSNTEPPICWSVYTDSAQMLPNQKSKDMQHENCVECPKFQWGSDPQGGRGKACKNRFRIAVMSGSVQSVDEIDTAEIRFGTLPVTSGNDFEKFISECKVAFNRPTFGVFSELKVQPHPKNQFEVLLKPLALVPGSLIMSILNKVKTAEKDIMYEFNIDTESEAPAKLKE